MKATIPLVARKGRASYLGERSAGHQDPGATSSWLLLKTAADTLGDAGGTKGGGPMADYVGAIDQGTTSTRFMIFDHAGQVVAVDQKEHEQIYPKPGWVEHDPMEIMERTHEVIAGALKKAGISASDLAAVGVTNQRETTVVWERSTGKPIYNALVWQDTRTTRSVNELVGRRRPGPVPRAASGLPLATYFSGPKIRVDPRQRRGSAGARPRPAT